MYYSPPLKEISKRNKIEIAFELGYYIVLYIDKHSKVTEVEQGQYNKL